MGFSPNPSTRERHRSERADDAKRMVFSQRGPDSPAICTGASVWPGAGGSAGPTRDDSVRPNFGSLGTQGGGGGRRGGESSLGTFKPK